MGRQVSDAHGADNAVRPVIAVAARVLVQISLVVLLGQIKRPALARFQRGSVANSGLANAPITKLV